MEGATGFDTRGNMWFAMSAEQLFECSAGGAGESSTSWLNVWLAVVPASVLWGGGTAAGEIPPYWCGPAYKTTLLPHHPPRFTPT